MSSGPEVIADDAILHGSEVKHRMTSLGVVISQQEFFTRPPVPRAELNANHNWPQRHKGHGSNFPSRQKKSSYRWVITQSQGIIVFLLPTILYIGISATNTERPRQRSGGGGNEPAELMAEREIVEPTIIKVQFTSVSRQVRLLNRVGN